MKDPFVTPHAMKDPFIASARWPRHGANNADGDLPHLQVHTNDGPIVRVFWRP